MRRIARFFARNRRSRWVRSAHAALVRIHQGFENLDYDMRSNGELRVISVLSRFADAATLFDVGASRGDWSSLALGLCPRARIHAFEIVPDTFQQLSARFHDEENVVLNRVGLFDREGTIEVYFSPGKGELATCVPGFSERFHGYRPTAQPATVTTGDAYCAANRIERIDFLKIDVEGLEPNVLRGFEGMLGRGAVEAIQFEYGYVNIDTHFLLRDFYDYLGRFGMAIGKIYPHYVEFRDYRHAHEDFYGPNFLAVKSNRHDLIDALSDAPSGA